MDQMFEIILIRYMNIKGKYVESFSPTRYKVNLKYINIYKLHFTNQFCKIELGLESTFWYQNQV